MLRWWRTDIAGLSQRELADRLGVARTAVTNWEKGSRMASIDAERIDDVLAAGGVLTGWLWSFGTPEGLQPRRIWSNAFRGGSTPVWMWIRSPARRLVVEAEWGMYRLEGELDLGDNGLLITVGVSIEESPVVVQLSEPGWIDFGRGDIPDHVEGAPVVDALDMVMPSTADGDFTELLSTNLVMRFGQERPPQIASLSEQDLKPVESLIERLDQPDPPRSRRRSPALPGSWPELHEGVDDDERSKYTRLREARRLSLAETSHRLAAMTTTTAGKDTLRRYEANIGDPHDPLLPVALDHVLGANGYLALVQIASGEGTAAVNLPPYWNAPVWITFATERGNLGPRRVAELQWGKWRRPIDGRLPLLVVNHAPLVPLRIVADTDIRWAAGVGRRIGATPINHGWIPDSIDTTQQALSTYQEVLFDAVRHASEHHRH